MKTNLILISFLERIYKAKRPEDFKSLLIVQIELNRLDKENRLLRELVESSNARNIKMESKAHISESKRLSLLNSVDVSEGVIKELREEINELTENLDI
jgi:hypothetical protein